MALNVFLSYSTEPDENVIVWRLQTLAAANGIEVFVPPRIEGKLISARPALLSAAVRRAIEQADCVLAIITTATSSVVESELNYALAKNRTIIPIVESGIADSPFLRQFQNIFRFDRTMQPGQVESEVVQFLKGKAIEKDRSQTIAALVGIGIGLLLLAGASKD
ncbi:MAG TPA: toll/interleukin-1 receptor domain-containing protein [Candidatus Acidoferrales bacterium]|nr:toll/interleukin-1 receptor domain-containing protein [Candidatus Acidoferrales bacterium]